MLTETQARLYEKLAHDMGPELMEALSSADINEIMVNPNQSLWFDSQSRGLECVGELPSSQTYAIIYGVAGLHHVVISRDKPFVEAEFPHSHGFRGERFTAQIPPMVFAPVFNLRKRAEKIYSLSDYVKSGRLTKAQHALLLDLLTRRANILVCGGPGSGKTTLTNALLQAAVSEAPEHRFVLLEDVSELQCAAPNHVNLYTTSTVSMNQLLRSAMRMRPDRLIVGEVRGAEALDLLKAWNTGCPGGICTVHANGVEEALQRISDLVMEAGLNEPPTSLIRHTIDAVVSIQRRPPHKGFVETIYITRNAT